MANVNEIRRRWSQRATWGMLAHFAREKTPRAGPRSRNLHETRTKPGHSAARSSSRVRYYYYCTVRYNMRDKSWNHIEYAEWTSCHNRAFFCFSGSSPVSSPSLTTGAGGCDGSLTSASVERGRKRRGSSALLTCCSALVFGSHRSNSSRSCCSSAPKYRRICGSSMTARACVHRHAT
jgi:hypothetical protein